MSNYSSDEARRIAANIAKLPDCYGGDSPYRQNHTRVPKAADSQAPAARNGLMIL